LFKLEKQYLINAFCNIKTSDSKVVFTGVTILSKSLEVRLGCYCDKKHKEKGFVHHHFTVSVHVH